MRADLNWLSASSRGSTAAKLETIETTESEESDEASVSPALDILQLLKTGGACFHHQLIGRSTLTAAEVEEGLWELVWRGLIHSDSFHAVRSLFDARDRKSTPSRSRRGLRRGTAVRQGGEGRWTLLGDELIRLGSDQAGDRETSIDPDDLAEAVAEQLLARWGVVFHALAAREQLVLPWREILWALRRLEARGLILGGRFVSGFSGEQFATPEAADHLDRTRRTAREGVRIELNASDPANLTGIVTPGPRVRASRTRSITYVDGLPEQP